jgi:hypothetical protein
MVPLFHVVPCRRHANQPAPALPQHYGSCPLGCAGSDAMPTDQHPLCLSLMVRLFQVVPCRRDANRPAPRSLSAMVPLFHVVPCRRHANQPAPALPQHYGSCPLGCAGSDAMPTDRHPLCGNYALLVGMEQTVCPPHVPQCTPAGFVKPPRPPKSASSIPSPDLEKLTTTSGDSET